MRVLKQGLEYSFHGDTLLRRWPWAKDAKSLGKYKSNLYDRDFNSLSDYWTHVGALEEKLAEPVEKVTSFSWETVLEIWVNATFPGSDVVILKDIRYEAKGLSFWARLPVERIAHLTSDVVVLRCKDRQEVTDLLCNIDTSFADAYGFSGGKYTWSNHGIEEWWNDEKEEE